MDITEYKRTSSEFLRLASNMLRTTHEMKNVHLVRLRKFIQENPLISNIINRKIEGVICKEDIIYSTNGFWLAIKIPYDEAEHLRGIYDHLIEMTEEPCDLVGIALKFPLSSNKYDDKIQHYLEKAFKPLVDFIINELRKEAIDMEQVEKSGITINIGKQIGTTNVGQGDIYSVNTVNVDNSSDDEIKNLKELVEKLVGMLQTAELEEEVKEEVIDDLETISEQVTQEQPKKVKIKKAYEGIKQFMSKIPSGITNATAMASGMNLLVEEIGKLLMNLK